VAIKKTKGNISKTTEGELINDKYTGYRELTSLLLKNSISFKIFSINTRLIITKKTLKNDFINPLTKNFVYVFIFLISGR
jgi:hypothetical protein